MLGNIDQSLYCPYKGFTNYPLVAKTTKGQLLSEVMMYDFNVHELNLYLDLERDSISAPFSIANEFAKNIVSKYPQVMVKNIFSIYHRKVLRSCA